ncbi:2-oxoacid:acceptor oxidoreductase family protein [candidate division KSB1 bacterium]
MGKKPKYPGIRITTNGNQLVAYYTEARLTDAGIFYPITPSTEMGENYQLSFAEGKLNVFGAPKIAIEAEGEHAAQAGAIAYSVTGKRVVNFTSGQGLVYGIEQYYHAPGKLSTMIVEIAARALTKHALNVHCGHDDIYTALDTGWIMLMGKDSQQTADQALIARKVAELCLNPGMNIQDGFLTSHLERTFFMHESDLIREFLGAPDDIIECPTEGQRELFGPTRRRVPGMIDLKNPILLGPVQNQEHYMQGIIARRNNFSEPIMDFLKSAYKEFGELTGRHYGLISTYKTEDAKTVFVSLGSAAENIEAGIDYLRDKGESAGSIHLNVIRPFPEAAVIEALKGKENVIILERTDDPLAGDNPMARDIRTAFTKALENNRSSAFQELPKISSDQIPRFFSGVYGLGSRDFRPEGILGAYEFAVGKSKRTDGKSAKDGISYFVLGIDHPYEVRSENTPSFLPEKAIAVRLHSIGGWGMITTGKNLGEVIGEMGVHIAKKSEEYDEFGRLKELVHVSANPKYGSEKKGAPTEYFLVVAPERIRVNCDLHHVNVVLCCDPKAFLHTNPLEGIVEGGSFVWESDETPEKAWERIPKRYRNYILKNKIRVFVLPGFEIARKATDRPDLQMRMQGNSFLGAFFRVSPFLDDNSIDNKLFHEIVRKQYVKKFGRFGDAVVDSNMEVMMQGFERCIEIKYGIVEDPDRSSMLGTLLHPVEGCSPIRKLAPPKTQEKKKNVFSMQYFDDEFRSGKGYDKPSTALSSVGMMASATGATASKYVARREKPVFIAENCTQCMKCIAACPDTALPNTAQEITTILKTAIFNYVTDEDQRKVLMSQADKIEVNIRARLLEESKAKSDTQFKDILFKEFDSLDGITDESKNELKKIFDILPISFTKTNAIFSVLEKKNPGSGGLFSIFVSDLCKGCAECVKECGDHDALRMVPDSDELTAEHMSAISFMDLLPDTPNKFLGLYDNENPQDSKTAALRNHLMVRSSYESLVSGDGACAGCGEKSVLHAIDSITEAFMRPLYHAKADRLSQKADILYKKGEELLEKMKAGAKKEYDLFVRAVTHIIMGLGGEDENDTSERIKNHGKISDQEIIDALVTVMRTEAFNHKDLQTIEGRLANGMSVMAMGAHTGCNTVYGSTPPNNPHPYPWMNSLFQDGVTVSWLFGESFITDHSRRSVIPERLADKLTGEDPETMTDKDYFNYTHFTDALMTTQEIIELPKAWAVGGDGGMGDIGYQNVSKVILQNRPNVKILMLDTQVYSNTGGQNSDSSVMLGGYDMNQMGDATQGKLIEKKNVAETFTSGHGSPFAAQVSMANAPKFYRAILDSLDYRGTAFLQCFSTCQPEHGVGDDMSTVQAQRVRDSRGLPEFVFNPKMGETFPETFDLKGNPSIDRDWWETKFKISKEPYRYTIANWCVTEARFRKHLKKIKETQISKLVHIDDMLIRIVQDDVVHRRFFNKEHRSYIPDFGVYFVYEDEGSNISYYSISRQMVLFCIERRKAWRLLQSKAGINNVDYRAQKNLLSKVDADQISIKDFQERSFELFLNERDTLLNK